MALTQIPIELSSTPGIVDNSNATAITIDSSENVLVGTTDTSLYNNTSGGGFHVSPVGFTEVAYESANSADPAFLVNNTGADGDIIQLRKDGTSVGSIASHSGGFLKIATAGDQAGMLFGTSAIYPIKNSVIDDAAVDLGGSSERFKDLYLSGGAYIGGTGVANHLDDYEEGTWTPTISSGTASFGFATYVKVGRLVHLTGRMQTISDTTSSTAVSIGGLPFTAASVQIATGSSFSGYTTKAGYYGSAVTYITASSSVLNFYWNGDSANYAILTHADFSSGASIYFSISYYANA